MPFLAEHSRPEDRNELFALQFAIGNATNIAAAIIGGLIAQLVANLAGHPADSPDTYRVLIAIMVAFSAGAFVVLLRLRDDRPRVHPSRTAAAAQDPLAQRGIRARFAGLRMPIVDRGRFMRLIVPGFIISIGAGQVIPFLNLFIQGKFGLEVASLNALFAVASLGTLVAVLIQPALARRFGKVGSIVLVQGLSIPFLLVLGFSPVFWTVAVAMAVRNSLMNAGNPIANAFAMEHVAPVERATLSATMSLLWSLGWVIGAGLFSVLQSSLGFEGGYAVNFLTITVLYTIATALYWIWFRPVERREMAAARAAR
jgi:MFS family permease